MIHEIDIWRAAHLLIEQHGEDAEFHAEQRALGMVERGDEEGEAAWREIIVAIDELRKGVPGASYTRH
jgi:hypothetical protein